MRITCRKCGNVEQGTFDVRLTLMGIAPQNDDGTFGDVEISARGRTAWLNCSVCGHTWATRRSLGVGRNV
jgi:hypothetical protein